MKEGWTYKKLGEVCRVINGRAYSKDEMLKQGKYRLLRVGNFFTNDSWYYSDLELEEDKYCDNGDLLYAWSASFGPRIWDGEKVIYHYHIWKMVCSAEIDKFFLYYWLDSDELKKQTMTNLHGATMSHITKGIIENAIVSYPSFSVQQAIVSRLDAAFAQIDALKANAEKQLSEARQLFQAELTECMRPKEGWEEKKMTDLYDVRDGTHDSPKYYDTGYPLVTSKNLKGGILDMSNVSLISEEDYKAINYRSKVDIGDVLFAMIGTIGNPVLVKDEPNYAIKNMALFKVPSNQSGDYLRYYLLNDNVLLKMQTESKGTTQKFVSLGYLRNFLMAIPSLPEQRKIVDHLDTLSANIRKLEEVQRKTIAECDALKQAMLREIFE